MQNDVVQVKCVDCVLTQRVHLQLLPQAHLLQAVVEVGFWAAAHGGRQGEDPHDLPLVSVGQGETDN